MIDLPTLCSDDGIPIEAVAEYLDGLSPSARAEQTLALGRSAQRGLYRKALAAPKITTAHFVPEDRDPLVPVGHAGRNTLPLPGRHKRFRKVFTRPQDGSDRLFGYNDAPSRKLIGPGYFVARPSDRPEWSARGAVVVDYFQVPDGPVAPGWPPVKSNASGLQVLVYHRTRDFMRRVSAQVSIGAAYKGDKALDHYFVLVRER